MDLVGVKEVAELLGWDHSKVSVYLGRGKLPTPVAHLAAGPIWYKQDIEAFATTGVQAVSLPKTSASPHKTRTTIPRSDHLWIGAFWHQILYPQISPGGLNDFGNFLAQTIKRTFGSTLPDYVAAARMDGLEDLKTPAQRKAAAALLRLLHSHLERHERKLLGFAHEGFLYFCGFFPDMADKPASCLDAVVDRLRHVILILQSERGQSVTFGLCARAAKLKSTGNDAYLAFHRSAQYAVVALRTQLHNNKGQVGINDEPDRKETSVFPAKITEWLRQVVQTGNVDRVAAVCLELSDYLFGYAYIPLLQLRALLQTLLVSMTLATQAVGVESAVIYTLNTRYRTLLMAPYDYTQVQQILKDAIADFTSAVAKVLLRKQEHPAVQAAEKYIRQHSKEPLSLPAIAKVVGLSAPYLSKLFNTYRGISITDFINHERVETARNLLLDPFMSITNVAFAAGFGSLQHFNRVFRATQGCTPTYFRSLKSV